MANRRSRGRAFSKPTGPKNNIWTVVLSNQGLVTTGAQTAHVIVSTTDWQRGVIGGSERATILRVRGYVSFAPKIATGTIAGGSIVGYVTVVDEDISLDSSPSVASTYIDEDILWTRGTAICFQDAGEAVPAVSWDMDIKSMRKIRIGQELRFVWSNATAGSVEVTLVLRALLRVGGN